ncbi:NAD(P)-binding domain-containing protein [Synechococcus sp. A18-25c]|uniref:SDR family oxidoreductase n=1 Tax=Synechococcus sp. A18-25c TaxID=1866938 RepID=UPI0016447EDC|nr:SDR family oxidoreductase [Synechococcus sp. A18-25c]QNJ20818.1 NAD(P)-binding domain-containing protein [Synechococcus sp. A18-25c]
MISTLVVLGAGGFLGKKFVEVCLARLDKDLTIIAVDINISSLNSLAELNTSNLKLVEADVVLSDYINDLPLDLAGEITFINFVAKDFPVTSEGIVEKFPSPFSLLPNQFCMSLNITCGSSYNLLHLLDKHGLQASHVIMIGSIYTYTIPNPVLYSKTGDIYKPVAYSAGKSAQIPLVKQAARYLARFSGRCNCVSFGGIQSNQNSDFVSAYHKLSPQSKLVPVNDALKTLQWIVFDSPTSLNGADIMVDGGFTC